MLKPLLKIRLSTYFWIFLVTYGVLSFVLPSKKFESSALTLFSVNSLLYGFYIAPILAAQKARIEELHKVVRAEANALFAIALTSVSLPNKQHNDVMQLLTAYAQKVYKNKRVGAGEDEYEALIHDSMNNTSDSAVIHNKILDQLIANQINRSNLALQMANKVFSNEWWIMIVLFSISISFVMLLDIGDQIFLHVVKALLCTGLSMLLVILIKLSTLTHKKAKLMWQPLKKLLDSNFYRID